MKYFIHKDYRFTVVAYCCDGVWYWRELMPGQRRTGSDPARIFLYHFEPYELPLKFAHNVRAVDTAGIPN